MEKFFAGVSKNIVVLLTVGIGVFFILTIEPPFNVCTSYVENFKNAQQEFLFSKSLGKAKIPPLFVREKSTCEESSSPGGCHQLFNGLKNLVRDLGLVPEKCNSTFAEMNELRGVVFGSLKLIIRLAWGASPPKGYYDKRKWLSREEMWIFCQLKSNAKKIFGESSWVQLRENLLVGLPGASELSREQAWNLILLSENCGNYQ